MRKKNKLYATLTGTVLFFVLIAAVVTVAVIIYGVLEGVTGGNKAIISAVMLLVILFLALVCTVIDLVRRSLTADRPLAEILEATDKIAKGNFSVRLEIKHPYPRYDDYDLIKENLNKMAVELSRTEMLHTDFISNVSHEIKTPLVAIQNYSAYLRKKDLDEAKRAEYVELLLSASKRLTALVTNILKLNKLENQEIAPEKERFNLSEKLAETVIGFEEAIEDKNLSLVCDIDENVFITSLPAYLEIIFNNLLSNAVKFTELGQISVSLKREKEKAVIKVSDTGCGISAEAGAHIFEKFYQCETSHAQEGNGLGLALVKKVIDIVGGEITVESESGKGSHFTVTLGTGG